jgi:hypothetical protein
MLEEVAVNPMAGRIDVPIGEDPGPGFGSGHGQRPVLKLLATWENARVFGTAGLRWLPSYNDDRHRPRGGDTHSQEQCDCNPVGIELP